MQAAGKSNLKRVSLEMGGKSPNIIFADADCKKFLNRQSNLKLACMGINFYMCDGNFSGSSDVCPKQTMKWKTVICTVQP